MAMSASTTLAALTWLTTLTAVMAVIAATAWSAAAKLAWDVEVTWVVTSENELGVSVDGVDLYPGRIS